MRTSQNTASALVLVVALVALALAVPAPRAGAAIAEDPDSVFVEVHWSGFNVRLTAGGWIGFVAPEPRDDLLHTSIDPELAFKTIDSLLAAGFLWTLDTYPSRKDRLWVASDGTIGLGGSGVIDGGQVSIRLKVGRKDKRVKIDMPASPAAGSLMAWFGEFEELATGALFGG